MIICVLVVVCIIWTTVSVSADRLITIPTGTTVADGIKLECASRSVSGDGKAYWGTVGFSQVEIEMSRFANFGGQSAKCFGAQVGVLPETSFTPAIALGVRDLENNTKGKGMPYDGRAFFFVGSKSVPFDGGILLDEVCIHAGIGAGSLGGVFFGAEGRISPRLWLAVEYDTENLNLSAVYNIISALRIGVSYLKGDTYFRAAFSAKL